MVPTSEGLAAYPEDVVIAVATTDASTVPETVAVVVDKLAEVIDPVIVVDPIVRENLPLVHLATEVTELGTVQVNVIAFAEVLVGQLVTLTVVTLSGPPKKYR